MSFSYPVMLELRGRRAVVIGALAAADGKDVALRDAGADVTYHANGAWRPEDLDGAFIVVASRRSRRRPPPRRSRPRDGRAAPA